MTASPSFDELLMPQWMMGTPLGEIWSLAWEETGDPNLAMEAVRRSPEYDQTFAGNRREDGSLRYDENTYMGIVESYEDELLAVGINPDLYRSKFPDLISGLVSPAEFTTRVESMYERVIEATPEIRDFYAANYGMDMTEAAIVASFLDPDIGQAVIEKRIATSEIGGSAATRGFDVSRDYAASLERSRMTLRDADEFFGTAATMVPALSILASRHSDPDDDFDLNEFTTAMIQDDPQQRRRMRRLIAQENAAFTGGVQTDIARNRTTGGISGLVDT
jgi:hypothetical protein